VKFAFVAQEVAFPVGTMCRVLGVTRSGPRPSSTTASISA
jgi:hypothetical protein